MVLVRLVKSFYIKISIINFSILNLKFLLKRFETNRHELVRIKKKIKNSLYFVSKHVA